MSREQIQVDQLNMTTDEKCIEIWDSIEDVMGARLSMVFFIL